MMGLIADRDGVDVVITPAGNEHPFKETLDFNYGRLQLAKLEDRSKEWKINVYDGRTRLGKAEFKAYQFIADGVTRRTISLSFLELDERQRGMKRSYELVNFIIDMVTKSCDRDWGEAHGKPVVFIEQKFFDNVKKEDRGLFFGIFKKVIGAIVGGKDDKPKVTPDHDLVLSPIGDDVSMQLIEGHVLRSDGLISPIGHR
jgi:hypothetical protein